MRQYFFLAGGATSLIWLSPNAFRKSAKARSHFSIGFVMGTGKTLLKAARMAGWLPDPSEKRFPKTRQSYLMRLNLGAHQNYYNGSLKMINWTILEPYLYPSDFDYSCSDGIEEGDDSIWSIVGGKVNKMLSCP
ncbi:uncharacterized protein [Miscanthus floridulus]|uniref:uncharacterized protein n=1 Tax=Miscanthus floridulus TaxID=154761 RepID=UPI00345A2FF1